MSNGRDHRRGAVVHRVRDKAMIERVKILAASAAARDQNDINAHATRGKINRMDRVGHRGRRARALHHDIDHGDCNGGKFTRRHGQTILQRGARCAGDNGNSPRQHGQCALAGFLKISKLL